LAVLEPLGRVSQRGSHDVAAALLLGPPVHVGLQRDPQAGVTQRPLRPGRVGAGRNERCGEVVAQRMERGLLGSPGGPMPLLEHLGPALVVDRPAGLVGEHQPDSSTHPPGTPAALLLRPRRHAVSTCASTPPQPHQRTGISRSPTTYPGGQSRARSCRDSVNADCPDWTLPGERTGRVE